MRKFSLKLAQYAFRSILKEQKCHKIWKKAVRKTEGCKNKPKKQTNFIYNKPKNKQPASLQRNPQLHKKQAQFRGKTARLTTLHQAHRRNFSSSRCVLSLADYEAHPPLSCPFYLTWSQLRQDSCASCLKLYTKTLNPNISYTKLSFKKTPSKHFRSRKPHRSFVVLLSTTGTPTTPTPPALQSSTHAFDTQPPGCDLLRNAWAQLIRLRTGVGQFAANMKTLGLRLSDLCECGKMQTAHHILHGCTRFKPLCHIYVVDNLALLEYLVKPKFWPKCGVMSSVYERRRTSGKDLKNVIHTWA